ncbi:LysR family transcriptional regulator [Thioclava dalianensis]|uniref:LysR family transcriptional regulator n=1 Tax=Thioclava dalianensis TaxID=1185766 RepID=A0A074U116_9RHOB|nr:LysR family transcriptional regulator [Thioclava dalianensis]KEP68357.1 LysR family transcriptional regulator [Thioclava dalianensis]SFM73998.1 DNA-binding transcriptional regulator, LysR family [Thioclava dalianensis]
MKEDASLDDLALFLAVAEAGGLSGAARATGASVPTLSRRMTALEAQLGIKLFARGKRGYALSARGRELAGELAELHALRARVRRFALRDSQARVRVTAGQWTSRFIALNIAQVWTPESLWLPEFVASNADADIARREVDIGIRNRRPTQSWLAGRKTIHLRYAPFARAQGIDGFVTLQSAQATTPSERWLRATHPERIVTTANSARLALDLARAGIGQIILPVFAATGYPDLVQSGPDIEALAHDEWLVSHHDARHDPPIRAALDALYQLLCDETLRLTRS